MRPRATSRSSLAREGRGGCSAGPDCLPPPRFSLLGLWTVTVSGRKHSVRLCSPRQAEAERWGTAVREVIASKAPMETPTQLLLRDIEVRLRASGRRRLDPQPPPTTRNASGRWRMYSQELAIASSPLICLFDLPPLPPPGELWRPRGCGTHLPAEPHPETHQWGPLCPTPAAALWSESPR